MEFIPNKFKVEKPEAEVERVDNITRVRLKYPAPNRKELVDEEYPDSDEDWDNS